MPPVLRNLSASELTGPEVRELLRLATDFDDSALDRLVSEVLPRLTVLAAMDDDAGRTPSPWRPRHPVPAGLPGQVRRTTATPGRSGRRASTDGDAIGFCRALGFLDHPAPRDPRWPERRRYDCVLDVLDAL